MQRIAVIYFSKYGSTQKYAETLAQQLGGDSLAGKDVTEAQLQAYDALIWGAGLIAGRPEGIGKIRQIIPLLSGKRQYVFISGLRDTEDEAYYQDVVRQNFPPEVAAHIRRFYFLPGDMNPDRLGFFSRMMIRMVASSLRKKPPETLTDADKAMMEGKSTHHFSQEKADALAADVRNEGEASA